MFDKSSNWDELLENTDMQPVISYYRMLTSAADATEDLFSSLKKQTSLLSLRLSFYTSPLISLFTHFIFLLQRELKH